MKLSSAPNVPHPLCQCYNCVEVLHFSWPHSHLIQISARFQGELPIKHCVVLVFVLDQSAEIPSLKP